MSTPERHKSPISLSKRARHERKRSSGNFSIEELTPDDMGYDADVEVIKADNYEEAESESETSTTTPYRTWHNVDEDLAARMGRLGTEKLSPLRSSSERGRKRRSAELGDDGTLLRVPPSPDIEVQEVLDTASLPSPAKRRRKKSRRPNAARHALRSHNETWTDSSERAEKDRGRSVPVTSASTTPSDHATPKREADDDMMDVT